MSHFNPSKRLPETLAIKSLNNQLYRLGLCTESYTDIDKWKDRDFINNPLLIATIILIQAIKSVANLIIDDNWLFIITGDFGRILGFRVYYNSAVLLFAILNLSTMLIWCVNKLNGVDAKFLNIFRMLSGEIAPITIGLIEEKSIITMIKRTKMLVKIAEFNSKKVATSIVTILTMVTYLFNATLVETLVFGVINCILFSLFACYGFMLLLFHGFYFYIVCYFIRSKIKINNELLLQMNVSKKILVKICNNFDLIYTEINDYNSKFWSKYFLVFWTTLGTLNVFLLYIAVFVDLVIIYKLMFFYVFTLFLVFFLFVILSASSVNRESNNTYKILNSLFVFHYSNKNLIDFRNKRKRNQNLLIKLKVRVT